MKFIRVLKAGLGAGLTLTNFKLKFTDPIKLEENNDSIGIDGKVSPSSIKIVSFDVYDSDENFIGNFGEDVATVVDVDLNFGYTASEPIENGDNPIKVDTLIQNEPIEGYIGKGQWTYEYLKNDNIYEVHSDGCVMCFDYGYTADLSIWLKIKLDGANLLNILNEQDGDVDEI